MPLTSRHPRPLFGYQGRDIRVMFGVATGEALEANRDHILDDHYALTLTAQRLVVFPALGITDFTNFPLTVSGQQAAPFCTQKACLTLITQDGNLVQILLFALRLESTKTASFAVPLQPLQKRMPHRLIAVGPPLVDWPERGSYALTANDAEHRFLLSEASARSLSPS